MAEYIERAVLMERLTSAGMQQKMKQTSVSEAYNEFLNLVNNVPAADVAPVRRGHWIEENDCQICSECGEEHCWDEYRAAYCDSCGAKMEKKDNYKEENE